MQILKQYRLWHTLQFVPKWPNFPVYDWWDLHLLMCKVPLCKVCSNTLMCKTARESHISLWISSLQCSSEILAPGTSPGATDKWLQPAGVPGHAQHTSTRSVTGRHYVPLPSQWEANEISPDKLSICFAWGNGLCCSFCGLMQGGHMYDHVISHFRTVV